MMFTLTHSTLTTDLPSGLDQRELVEQAKKEIDALIKSGDLYGKAIQINGRITTGMALMLGHKLAHVCKSVSIFDPKMNDYILCVHH